MLLINTNVPAMAALRAWKRNDATLMQLLGIPRSNLCGGEGVTAMAIEEIRSDGRGAASSGTRPGSATSAAHRERALGRIDCGYYSTPSVAEKVAERLLESGDLDVPDEGVVS